MSSKVVIEDGLGCAVGVGSGGALQLGLCQALGAPRLEPRLVPTPLREAVSGSPDWLPLLLQLRCLCCDWWSRGDSRD